MSGDSVNNEEEVKAIEDEGVEHPQEQEEELEQYNEDNDLGVEDPQEQEEELEQYNEDNDLNPSSFCRIHNVCTRMAVVSNGWKTLEETFDGNSEYALRVVQHNRASITSTRDFLHQWIHEYYEGHLRTQLQREERRDTFMGMFEELEINLQLFKDDLQR